MPRENGRLTHRTSQISRTRDNSRDGSPIENGVRGELGEGGADGVATVRHRRTGRTEQDRLIGGDGEKRGLRAARNRQGGERGGGRDQLVGVRPPAAGRRKG